MLKRCTVQYKGLHILVFHLWTPLMSTIKWRRIECCGMFTVRNTDNDICSETDEMPKSSQWHQWSRCSVKCSAYYCGTHNYQCWSRYHYGCRPMWTDHYTSVILFFIPQTNPPPPTPPWLVSHIWLGFFIRSQSLYWEMTPGRGRVVLGINNNITSGNQQLKFFSFNWFHFIGGSWWRGGGARDTRRPLGAISFIFMQFSGKIGQIIGWSPHLGSWSPSVWEILDPPLHLLTGESEILTFLFSLIFLIFIIHFKWTITFQWTQGCFSCVFGFGQCGGLYHWTSKHKIGHEVYSRTSPSRLTRILWPHYLPHPSDAEGNSFSLYVSSHPGGGYPISIP